MIAEPSRLVAEILDDSAARVAFSRMYAPAPVERLYEVELLEMIDGVERRMLLTLPAVNAFTAGERAMGMVMMLGEIFPAAFSDGSARVTTICEL